MWKFTQIHLRKVFSSTATLTTLRPYTELANNKTLNRSEGFQTAMVIVRKKFTYTFSCFYNVYVFTRELQGMPKQMPDQNYMACIIELRITYDMVHLQINCYQQK
jgi:hypothetical protein